MAAQLTVPAFAGETVDQLVWRATGSAAVEAVLKANRGLAGAGAHLAEGQLVTLPQVAATPAGAPLTQLWD